MVITLKCITMFSYIHSLLQRSSAEISLAIPKLGETALWQFRLDAKWEVWEEVYRVFYNVMAFSVFQYILKYFTLLVYSLPTRAIFISCNVHFIKKLQQFKELMSAEGLFETWILCLKTSHTYMKLLSPYHCFFYNIAISYFAFFQVFLFI